MSQRVLIRPYVTEKTTYQMEEGKYGHCGARSGRRADWLLRRHL